MNLDSQITVKLNELGVERTNQRIQGIKENPILTQKEDVIELAKSRIDTNGYLTAPLQEVLGQYDSSCFDSKVAIVHEIDNEENHNILDTSSRLK